MFIFAMPKLIAILIALTTGRAGIHSLDTTETRKHN